MQTNRIYLIAEVAILFLVIPVILVLPIPLMAKLIPALLGLIYAVVRMIQQGVFKKNDLFYWNTGFTWKTILVRTITILLSSILFVWFFYPEKLFAIVFTKPGLWIGIFFIYGFVSVIPQEIVYRSFFLERYKNVFINRWVMILVNAIAFSLAHLFLKNWLVLGMTFAGSIMFTLTYQKSRSLLITCIEHAFYGWLLFTIGLGEILAFPAA